MSKYLITGSCSADGVKGLMQEGGSKRRDAAAAVESVGGSMDVMYYSFGDADVIAVCDIPDPVSAAAVSMLINSSGAVGVTLTPLLTVEEIDAAAGKTPSYRPPGS